MSSDKPKGWVWYTATRQPGECARRGEQTRDSCLVMRGDLAGTVYICYRRYYYSDEEKLVQRLLTEHTAILEREKTNACPWGQRA